MALTITPHSATVSSPSAVVTFSWRVSGGSASATGYGISDSPISTTNTDVYASGSSGTLRLGVGTYTFYGFYTTTSGPNTYYYSLGSASVSVVYKEPEPEPSASYSIDYTSTTLTFNVSGLTSGQSVDLYARLQSDTAGASPVVNENITATGSTLTKTYSGLSPGQDYIANVRVAGSWLGSTSFTTPAAAVDLWDWAASNGEASAAQTAAAYAAVTGGGSVSDFSYLVWNDMCAKVKAVLDAAGKAWVTKITATGETLLSYEATRMTASGRTLTAARFNALRFNVGANYTTGIAAVATGDAVLGSYFTTLMEKVNEWIETL